MNDHDLIERIDRLVAEEHGLRQKAEGQGLADNPVTTVTIPCPTCAGNNQIWFTPEDGRLHRVTCERRYQHIPEPSRN